MVSYRTFRSSDGVIIALVDRWGRPWIELAQTSPEQKKDDNVNFITYMQSSRKFSSTCLLADKVDAAEYPETEESSIRLTARRLIPLPPTLAFPTRPPLANGAEDRVGSEKDFRPSTKRRTQCVIHAILTSLPTNRVGRLSLFDRFHLL